MNNYDFLKTHLLIKNNIDFHKNIVLKILCLFKSTNIDII